MEAYFRATMPSFNAWRETRISHQVESCTRENMDETTSGWVGRSAAVSLATGRNWKNPRIHHPHRVQLTRLRSQIENEFSIPMFRTIISVRWRAENLARTGECQSCHLVARLA